MGGMRGPSGPVDNKKMYEVLGVEKTASFDEIKKAYRKAALKEHPDRGGDKEKFQELQKAYEILGDKDKRDKYDKYGEKAVTEESGHGGGGGMGDIFDLLGGRRGGGQ